MNILITDQLSTAGIAILRDAGHTVDERYGMNPPALHELMGAYEVLLVRSGTKVDAAMIARMDRMKIIGRAGAGVDNIDVPAATGRGIIVMNTPGGNTRSAAEHTIAMLFSLARNIPFAHASLTNGTWDRKKWNGIELQGKKLGVIGFGRIGREVATMAHALGMVVSATDDVVPPDAISAAGFQPLTVSELLSGSDIITVHVPLLPKTRHLLSDREFQLCRKGVRIINCSRGGIIDEEALVRALDSGIVAGAALDVFEQEPPPIDNPLLHHPHVVVTPHIGAATAEAQSRVATDIARQVVTALSGGPVVGRVA